MNGNKLFLDTNIVLYLLAGDTTQALMINNKDLYVSFITEMELLCFNNFSPAEQQSINELLAESIIVEMSLSIKQQAIEIRKTSGLKIPDSIIAASCMYMKIPLLTADSGFSRVKLLDYLHYQK